MSRSRASHEAIAALRASADQALSTASEAAGTDAARPALEWLELGRPGGVRGRSAQVPVDAAGQAKMFSEQADRMVGVVRQVLDGLGLPDAEWERGLDLAIKALQESTDEGWLPL